MNFISENQGQFPVAAMCRLLGVSRQGWRKGLSGSAGKRLGEEADLLTGIRRIHKESRKSYGSPRIADVLEKEGWGKCRNRVARLMAREGIRAKTNSRKAPRTTDSGHDKGAAPNLAKLMDVGSMNQLWQADITYIRTWEGFTYLAAVLDSSTRKIVGWHMDDSLHSDLVVQALEKAVERQKPAAGLVVHSDRGIQYASEAFRSLLDRKGFCQSMSRKGNCYDNAKMESFFGTLKREQVDGRIYRNRREARLEVFSYIEGFYNSRRIHTSLGGLSPAQAEAAATAPVHRRRFIAPLPPTSKSGPFSGAARKNAFPSATKHRNHTHNNQSKIR
jgi:transposase InsO family protein